ncbi:MAG TPA: hypothetical protein VFF28_02525 [Candidatus Nanoarchaeia archaeon]|nr:hypothetical protein [Candidatus Nanoarchaeia archaeon]
MKLWPKINCALNCPKDTPTKNCPECIRTIIGSQGAMSVDLCQMEGECHCAYEL